MHFISSPMLLLMLLLSAYIGFFSALKLAGADCAELAGKNTRAIFAGTKGGE